MEEWKDNFLDRKRESGGDSRMVHFPFSRE
jgi:hypothetical protein